MRATNIFILLLFVVFTFSCSAIHTVKTDYDQHANFSNLKTFDWMQAPEKAGINDLGLKRVKNAVNAELKAKGLMMASNNPDFLIAAHLGKKDKVQVSNWGYDYGPRRGYGGGYWGGGGVSTYKYEEGSLILDFVDAESKNMIWRGSAKANVDNTNTPEKKEKVINEAVQKILKNFPPDTK